MINRQLAGFAVDEVETMRALESLYIMRGSLGIINSVGGKALGYSHIRTAK